MSRWKWLWVPLALGLGAAGGAAVTRQIMIRSIEARDHARELAAELRAPELPAPPPPPPARSRSPFHLDGDGEGEGMPVVENEEAPLKVEPPLVIRDRRVDLEPPPGYFDLPAPDKQDGTDPPIIKVGQIIQVEVLEALPGRPITGDRYVRSDGTISLGFYGDLRVAGLNRYQIKVKLLEQLRKYITDEVLGLVREDGQGVSQAVPPIETNRVFIDETRVMDSTSQEQAARPSVRIDPTNQENTISRMNSLEVKMASVEVKMDLLLRELKQIRKSSDPTLSPGAPSAPFAPPTSSAAAPTLTPPR
jgi:hypothetical protein